MAFESDKTARRYGSSNQQTTDLTTIAWLTRTKFISKIGCNGVSNTV